MTFDPPSPSAAAHSPTVRVKLLGTGTSTGIPIPSCPCAVCHSTDPRDTRLRTAAMIEWRDKTYLIDASVDLRQQALRHNIQRVDSVLYTHAHADHILGTDDLRCFNFGKDGSIPCYATPTTARALEHYFDYIFHPNPSYEGGMLARLTLHPITHFSPISLDGLTVVPFPVLHGSSEVTGFRFGPFGYVTDCKVIPPESREVLRNVPVLFRDGLRYREHRTHLTIPEAIELSTAIGAQQTYLIHMTHEVSHAEVERNLPPNIRLGYDGLGVCLADSESTQICGNT